MERVGKFHKEKDTVFNKLYEMSSFDRIRLIDKYTKMAEPVFSSFKEETIIEIVAKLLSLKFSQRSLIDTFIAGDPVVDKPGYRFEDFLNHEFVR